jgi:hypothetical protein
MAVTIRQHLKEKPYLKNNGADILAVRVFEQRIGGLGGGSTD